jgi:PAS domain S-box-containing protein
MSGHPRAARHGLPLRWRLILLVVSGIVPLVVFSLLLQYWAFRANVASMGDRALEQAHNLSVAVARELDGCLRGLQVLAAAPALRADQLDLDALRQRADALATQFPGSSVTLLQKDGRELLNTRAPPGAPLPASGDRETMERVFETGQPAVSGIYKASTDGRLTVAVDVPVKREDGRIAYVLSMHPGLQIFDSVIHQARLPAAWVIAVFDQHALIVARSPNPEQFVGHPGALASSDSFTRNLEGFLEDGESLEGISVLRAFSRTPPHDWTVGIGVPRVELTGPALASANTTFAVGGVLLLISIAMAAYAARRIGGPIESLRHLAAAPDRDALPTLALTGLPEVDEVARALHTSEDERRRSREAELVLRDAIDTMPEGFVIYDDQGRLVMCNQSYRNFYQENTADLVPGVTFEEILRAGVGRGRFPDALGCEEEWIAERLRRQREPQEPIEQKLADGRWALMTKHSLANGWIVGLRVDITDLKGAEEALRVGEERFRRVVEAVANAIIMVGADGTIEMVNVQAEAIFGYPRAELLGRPIEVLLPEHYRSHHPGLRNAFFADPQARLMGAGRDLNAVRQDGTEFPVEIGLSPIETADGSKVLASIIDITPRRQAQRMQAYYAAIVESSADAIIAKDLNGVVTSWNKAAELIFGYSASEMVGEPITRLLPDGRLNEEDEILARVHRGERIDLFETVRRRKDGVEFPVSLTISPILGTNGEIIGASKIARDITERKRTEDGLRDAQRRSQEALIALTQSEEQLKRAQQIAQLGSYIWDWRTDKVEWSDETYQIFGVVRGTYELTRENILRLIHPDDRGKVLAVTEAVVRGTTPAPFEYRIVRPDGGVRHVYRDSEIIKDEAGNPQYLAGTFQDVTERRRTEDQLRQAQKMEAIGNLTGGMAHDFNNMLGVVIGNLDLARERLGEDEDLREIVSEALEAAWRGADLTRRLLAFARRQPLRPALIDVNALVGDTVRLLHRLLGEDIEVALELGTDIWPVSADPAQLESSLANLATNARDAMPTGGRLIIATANRNLDADYAATHADVTPGDFVTIEVSDTGAGISPETMSQIFEPFFTTKELGKGSGLGLSMVFGFLKQSGGHVSVYSEVGQGTTFRLYLPRATVEGAAHEAADTQPLARGAGETVLVVEDNPGMRRIVLRQLRELGYRVLECDRAAAALEILQDSSVDVLLTDIVMPGGLDGVKLARIAQKRWPALKIVLTSGFPQARVEGNGGLPGGLNLLSKPYHKEELAATLRAALDG